MEQTTNDLIKRSDAIGAITNHCENECYYRVDNWCPQCQREEFEEAIKAVPSADRPSGEWVISYTDDYGIKKTECSACGVSFITYDVYGWKYCPWCGASMREREGE